MNNRPGRTIIVNGQPIRTARNTQLLSPRDYFVEPTVPSTVAYVAPARPRVALYRRGNNVVLFNESPVIQVRSTLESWHVVAVVLGMLVLMLLAVGVLLAIRLIVSGQL